MFSKGAACHDDSEFSVWVSITAAFLWHHTGAMCLFHALLQAVQEEGDSLGERGPLIPERNQSTF